MYNVDFDEVGNVLLMTIKILKNKLNGIKSRKKYNGIV